MILIRQSIKYQNETAQYQNDTLESIKMIPDSIKMILRTEINIRLTVR